MLFNRLISPNKLIVGGAAIFAELNKNHHKAMLGIKFNKPLLINKLRLPNRSYEMLAKQNKPEEHSPCATIKEYAPQIPQYLIVIKPLKTIPIWQTEEYAIKDFKSVCRKHTSLTNTPPTKLILIQIKLYLMPTLDKNTKTRNNPYPPNFNKTPAKIIEPETGASTWALGNHKWTKNIGILTKKAKIIPI